jgi:glutamyl-Q tRNA(Asp) synthetase
MTDACWWISDTSPVITGRFAPSPTGPLHLGSLVAAAGSWLFARAQGGRWLMRMEDLDTPRLVRGSDVEILEALRRYGLEWDGEVVYQSQRIAHFEGALRRLRESGAVFDCGCSRAESEAIYPGTCRRGLPAGRTARAVRFIAPDEVITFNDALAGTIGENVARETGDFVIKRADGIFAYQLAVVVDDALQGVNQVVRGGDLLTSTARQIALQRALAYPTPSYAHVPLVTNPDGSKLGKRDGALPLPTLDAPRIAESLQTALRILGVEVERSTPQKMLQEALSSWKWRT